jgi:hypothetical protein
MQQTPGSGPRRLDPLVGDWTIEAVSPHLENRVVNGTMSFEWLAGEKVLVQRWRIDAPEFPDGIAVIGEDEEAGTLRQHYFDGRGVSRVYEMSLEDGVWTLVRSDPDFSQRFTGRFTDGGDTIEGAWEISADGETWEHDFDLTYRRTGWATSRPTPGAAHP